MTTFEVYKHLAALRHLSSMELLSYRDALRDMNLSVERPKRMVAKKNLDERQDTSQAIHEDDDEPGIIGAGTIRLLDLIDTRRVKDGTYKVKGVAETAIDHHIAVNLILRDRGFTAAIDKPEIEIDETLLD